MVQFPYKAQNASPGQKRAIIIYSVVGLLLVVVCLAVYSCTKKPAAEPAVADNTAATPAAAAPGTPAATTPAAPVSTAPAPVAGSVSAPVAAVGTTPPAITPESNVKTSPQALALINEANASLAQNKVIKARDTFAQALSLPLSAADQAAVKASMARLADIWLLGSAVLPDDTLCSNYTVKKGDVFINIGKNHKTDSEILQKINNITNPKTLRAGQTIKVINGPFRAVVSRSNYTLDLYLQNTFVKSFKVGLGKTGRETPTGLWEVTSDKSIKPKWTDPDTKKTYYGTDPDYPLGTRWIGLKGIDGAAKGRTGFALHGTNKPEELGTNLSRGCIRLANPDVELLYSLLAPVSSQVSVVD
jgi:lipoprotein-anchoring transpeptidase ErfK/SrfK